MIVSFNDDRLENFWNGDQSHVPIAQLDEISLILSVLNAAQKLADIRMRCLDLRCLVGNPFYIVSVSEDCWIKFRFDKYNGFASEVEMTNEPQN